MPRRTTRLKTHLESREHLALLLAVEEVVMVLHRDERSEVVRYGIICLQLVNLRSSNCFGEVNILCIAETVERVYESDSSGKHAYTYIAKHSKTTCRYSGHNRL